MNVLKNIVVGAGLTGAVLAHKIAAELDEKVSVIDRRPHIAGNCYDEFDEEGLYIKKYGPHIFHTNDKRVWDFLSQFTQWHPFFLRTSAIVDGNPVNIPFNLDSIEKCFPKSLAARLEEKLLEKYEYNSRISILQLLEQDDKDLKFLTNYVYEKVLKLHENNGRIGEELINLLGGLLLLISPGQSISGQITGNPKRCYTQWSQKMLDHRI